jgi:hypothetical protein
MDLGRGEGAEADDYAVVLVPGGDSLKKDGKRGAQMGDGGALPQQSAMVSTATTEVSGMGLMAREKADHHGIATC